jgi:hypothetical protein
MNGSVRLKLIVKRKWESIVEELMQGKKVEMSPE